VTDPVSFQPSIHLGETHSIYQYLDMKLIILLHLSGVNLSIRKCSISSMYLSPDNQGPRLGPFFIESIDHLIHRYARLVRGILSSLYAIEEVKLERF
jgi:hypothetical protein